MPSSQIKIQTDICRINTVPAIGDELFDLARIGRQGTALHKTVRA